MNQGCRARRSAPLLLLAALGLAGCGPGGGAREDASAASMPGDSRPAAMFRANAAHTGVYEGAAMQAYGGLLWRAQTGGPIRSTPVLAGGRLFVGSSDGRLHALDARTGATLWTFETETSVTGSPAIRGTLVYVTDHRGSLYAVAAASGAPAWSIRAGPTRALPWGFESGDVYASSPVISGDTVFFGSGDGSVRAVDAGSGRVLWSAQTGGRVRSTPAVHAERVYVGSGDGVVYAFAREDGRRLWRHETEGASLDSEVFGFDRRTVQSSPAVVDGRVFIGARDGFLYALDATTGDRIWRVDHEVSWVNSSPAVSRGLVLAGTSDGQFFQAVDAATGAERWRVSTVGIVWTSPAVLGDEVIIAESAGRVRGLDLLTGETRWSMFTGGPLFGSPVPERGIVYVGSMDGGVYALRSGSASLARAVFWDTSYVNASWYVHHAELRTWLADRGYAVLNAAGLAAFLEERVRDGQPSSVVFAMDHVPDAVARGGSGSLFRRYLDSGGTVVWPSLAPFLWRRDPATGSPGELIDVDRAGAGDALDIDFSSANLDALGAFSTPAGVRLGLSAAPGWLTNWSVDEQAELEVLAHDELGGAAAWRRSYGGAPGTGLVRLWGNRRAPFEPVAAMVAAELRPE